MATVVTNFPMAFEPQPVQKVEDLEKDLQDLAQVLREPPVQSLALVKLHAAPAKVYDGMTVYADGTDWNPGAGEGVYTYYGAAWNRLG